YLSLPLLLRSTLFPYTTLFRSFYPAKIFMGDTGSLLIGLVSSMLVIKLLEVSGTPASPIPASGAPAIAISLLMIPLMDTLRVFSIRIINRRSPFSPDRNHQSEEHTSEL